MDSIFSWLAAGLGALLFVAVVVAWWEYLGHKAARHDLLMVPELRAGVTVDVDLDALPGDVAQRRDVLGHALARMTQPGSLGRMEDRRKRWLDTAPMVGTSLRPEERPAGASRAFAPSDPH